MAPPIKRTQYDVIEYLVDQWPDRKYGRLASMASRYAAFKGMSCKEIGKFFQVYMLTGENRGSKLMPEFHEQAKGKSRPFGNVQFK